MIPNSYQSDQRLHRMIQTLQNKESKLIQKEKQNSSQEITRDLLMRQKEYEKLNKVYTSMKLNHKCNSPKEQSKFQAFKTAVREAKLKFLLKSSCNGNNKKNYITYSDQQKHSIEIIAQIFRNQKSISIFKSPQKKQIRNKWNLLLLLIISIFMICLLIIIYEFNGLKK